MSVRFASGNDRIDSYFRGAVTQDVKRKYATCFVAREIATDRVAGFYATFGFTPFVRRPRTLYLPVTTALSLVSP